MRDTPDERHTYRAQGARPHMVDNPQADSKVTAESATPAQPPRRGPGHRGADARDTVAEMALRAQEISQESGSKIAQAMKDLINAAAGLAGFAIESARDLVQYMVRRGQMTQEEADRLIRDVEEASARRPAPKPAAATTPAPATKAAPAKAAKPAAAAKGTKAAPKAKTATKTKAAAAGAARAKTAAKTAAGKKKK
jgi:polyhydroxyalkanoate synthesis regulator phasin